MTEKLDYENVECAEGEKEYHRYCDFYEINEGVCRMTKKEYEFRSFEISKTENFLNKVKLYEISNINYSDDLDESNLFYVYSDSEENIIQIVDKLNELHEEKEILEVQLKSATTEIDKLVSEINTLTDTCHDCCKEIREENEQLKAQLYCDSDEGVCIICKHHYLEKGKTYEKYYISKCKKGHEQCSKRDLKYCDDFELKEGDV